jgi:hypothetical protein
MKQEHSWIFNHVFDGVAAIRLRQPDPSTNRNAGS